MGSRLTDTVMGKWHAAGSLAQFVRHFQNWREVWDAYRRHVVLPPLVLRDGLTIEHGAGDDPMFLFREIFVGRCYTKDGFYTPGPGDTVLDLGGNVGFFALLIQHLARGARVHSFEPAAETRRRLERNVAVNGLQDVVSVYPYAVSDKAGTLSLKISDRAGNTSLFDRDDEGANSGVEEVNAVTLSEAIKMTGAEVFDLLKIDVEGAEVEVVNGAAADDWRKFRRVIVEYHDNVRPGCRDHVVDALTRGGFASVEVLPEPHDPRLGYVMASRHNSE